MHVYQMRSSVPSVVAASQERINICMTALKEVSKVWLVAKMVHTLFESILGNKVLEEKLQKAAGKRAQKPNKSAHANAYGNANNQPQQNTVTGKRKYDEIDLGFSTGPPAPQVSYERSRPQTPSVTPSRDVAQQSNLGGLSSPNIRNPTDQFLPTGISRGPSRIPSRGGTRANSPFAGYSIPATPPDLFLVTRNSPPISQSLWENFQPDQLFPDGTNTMPFSSPPPNTAVDPQLQMPQQYMQQGWPQGMIMPADLDTQESDGWSTSSRGNAPVPMTLNVEDWFQFFGINGEMNGIGLDTN